MRRLAIATTLGLLAAGCGIGSSEPAAAPPTTAIPGQTTAATPTTERPAWLSPVTPAPVSPILADELAVAAWSVAGTAGRGSDIEISVDDYGAQADDGRSDSAAAAAAVAAATAIDGPVTITFGTGTYLLTETLALSDGVTVRGAGPSSQLVIDFGGSDGPGITATGSIAGDWMPVGKAPQQGAGELRLLDAADAQRFSQGDTIEIEQTNDESMYTRPEWKVDWGEGSVGELNRVVGIDGPVLRLEAPLTGTYRQDLSPRVRRIDPVEQVGIENLSLFRADDGYGSTVRFELVADAWIDDVVSRRTSRAHVGLNQVFHCRIEGSIFHDASDFGDGGRAYGVSLARHTTGCLVTNNTLYDLRHAVIVQLGASGNVVAYNHARGSAGYEDRQPRADLSLHGHWPQANLFEGNIVDRAVSADWWGPSGPANTFYRNCVRDHLIVADRSDDQVVIGNVIGSGGFTIEEGIEGSVVSGNLVAGPRSGLPDSAGDLDAGGPPSLFTVEAPEFLADYQWPPIDPARDGSACDLPASTRSPLGNR